MAFSEWDQYLEEPNVYDDDAGWAACSACGAYAAENEEQHETDTESEGELAGTPELQAYLGSFENCFLEGLRHEYYLARARYRHFAGKRTRRTRFPRFNPNRKGRGKGKGRSFRRTSTPNRAAWSFKGSSLSPSSLAGGKGARPMKGKGKGLNPYGKDGRRLRCFACGSECHMIEECPVAKSKGKGKSSGATSSRIYFEDLNADLAPGQEHLQGIGFHYHSETANERRD